MEEIVGVLLALLALLVLLAPAALARVIVKFLSRKRA
jgi:hypothetical protein